MMALQYVVKTFRRDLQSYLQLQDDLQRFDCANIRLCVPVDDLAAFSRIVAADVELVSSEQVLASFGFHRVLPESWYSQQLLKLLLVASSTVETCWVLDANTILLRPPPRAHDDGGRIVLSCDRPTEEDRQWYASSARFLGMPISGPRMAAVNQPLSRKAVRALLRFVAVRTRCHPVYALAGSMLIGQFRREPVWTEFGLYRSFATHVLPALHRFSKVRRTVYYRHEIEGRAFDQWLYQVNERRPAMVKVYARRPTGAIPPTRLSAICDRIRRASR
ncbi:MAG: hypothetical protein HOP13_01220 [Alphaproteobacteria bacterium]|nr:hypothetical protein [Alphaproteobacteria bacterium]